MSTVVARADLDAWVPDLYALYARVAYLTGLLAPVERKNGWQLAEAGIYTRHLALTAALGALLTNAGQGA